MKAWFVGLCKDQQELRAAAELRAQGYVVYLPKIHTRHQDGRKIEARTTLRFTGYIFIAFDLALGQSGPIRYTAGMDGSDGSPLIGGNTPSPLPSEIIETLRAIEDEELKRATERKKPEPRRDLVRGEMVRFVGDQTHPAYGMEGVYTGPHKRGIAKLFAGWKEWLVAEVDLKKIEQPEKRAA